MSIHGSLKNKVVRFNGDAFGYIMQDINALRNLLDPDVKGLSADGDSLVITDIKSLYDSGRLFGMIRSIMSDIEREGDIEYEN